MTKGSQKGVLLGCEDGGSIKLWYLRGDGLVEEENWRTADEAAREAHALGLSASEVLSAVTDSGVEARPAPKGGNLVPNLRGEARLFDCLLVVLDVGVSVEAYGDVVTDRVVEEHLTHVAPRWWDEGMPRGAKGSVVRRAKTTLSWCMKAEWFSRTMSLIRSLK